MKKIIATLLLMPFAVSAELVHQFKDPTFSGIGWASHVLTVESMRQSAQSSLVSKAAAEQARLNAEAANTPLARFMNLFTGQVYSQLATQLTNNLFQECVSGTCDHGNFMVGDMQQIQWVKLNGQVTLAVYDGTKNNVGVFVANASPTQTITVPISSFSF